MPWEPLLIMPVGDIQYDGPDGAADLSRLARHLKWGMAQGVWFLGMGDFVDFLSPSNRDRLGKAGLYDTATKGIDRLATMMEDELLQVIESTRGRWIGLLQGHHYFNHLDGTTSDTRFAKALDTPYLGDCALIRVTFKDDQRLASTSSTTRRSGTPTCASL